jgi:hypothetical protein
MKRKVFLLAISVLCFSIASAQTGESQFKKVSATKGESTTTAQPETVAQPIRTQAPATMAVSDVGINIPDNKIKDPNKFALIIGNEDYSSYQTGLNPEANVDFAERDAATFREYAIKTLGVPEDNIIYKVNAKSIEMRRMIEQASLIAKSAGGDAEIYFYYAGHGFPDIITHEPYIIPVDVSGEDLNYAIKLSDLYKKLTENENKRLVVFLDACFSGGARNVGLLAARGVRVKPKEDVFRNNIVVFTATSEDQPALPWKEKGHGMFTYYLLKMLQETSADVTYGELADYLSRNVGVRSAIINQREQSPKTSVGTSMQSSWRDVKIK